MSKEVKVTYKDLSRRGLIQMAEDFDEKNGDKLITFLNEQESVTGRDVYERIRVPEKVINKWDEKVRPTAEGMVDNAVNNLLSKGFDALSSFGSKIGIDLI